MNERRIFDVEAEIGQLWIHPVKSCAGQPVAAAPVAATGLEFDRAWMVVGEGGEFVSQRELPRLALISVRLRATDLVLRAPGMLALHLSLEAVEHATRARIWDDELPVWDMGDLAAQWFSDFLGQRLRVVRFDPEQRRQIERRWTDGRDAGAQFADAFPLLVVTDTAVTALNAQLAATGAAPVDVRRFRPNIVLRGLPAHEEDHIDLLEIDADEGPVRLLLTKPCARCSIPDVDPDTAATGAAVGAALRAGRRDPRLDGALTFGMNAIVLEGAGGTLRTGQRVRARYRFG